MIYGKTQQHQQGVVLFVALIVLVAMSIAAVALIRSVETNTLVAGNVAFKQGAIETAARAVEAAVGVTGLSALTDHDASKNYFASIQANETTDSNKVAGIPRAVPFVLQSLANYPSTYKAEPDGNGNTIRWVVERMCSTTGAADPRYCSMSVLDYQDAAGGTSMDDNIKIDRRSGVEGTRALLRLTIRVDGPKNTVSFAQSVLR